MSEYTDLSEFSSEGFNIGKDSKVLTYLHGLSDFWIYMFEDASKVNLLMEANAIAASDIYNRFLQLTSIISLEDISVLTNSQQQLILLTDKSNVGVSSPVAGKVNNAVETYYIPKETALKYAKCLANRPLMPTSMLEEDTDFYIDTVANTIAFSRPLSTMGFPYRVLTDGSKQYAIWAIDAKIDDNLVYEHYAKLIDISPATSSQLFKDFIYGLYYLYVNGPNLDTMRKGLNITLGIPLARDIETVLEIKKYLNTDQWLVITDLNSYIVPYGLDPTVAVGDILAVGQEIALWIEVKDYERDGDWWLNFMIPSHIMPDVPASVPGSVPDGIIAEATPNRYATPGSYADWLMRNYLKKHTFLVNVKTVAFKNIQSFEQLSEIIRTVKPSYTTPIYVWTVPTEDETLVLIDDLITFTLERERCECLTEGIGRFRRDATDPLIRGNCPKYTRMSAPSSLDALVGFDSEINGYPRPFNGGTVNGYIAPARTYSTISDFHKSWLKTLRTRRQDQYMPKKGKIDFYRDFGSDIAGTTVAPYSSEFPGLRLVYLHTTNIKDVEEKFATANNPIPADYMFTLFRPTSSNDLINEHAVNDSQTTSYLGFMQANFAYYFNKGFYGNYLGTMFGEDSYRTYIPDPSELRETDFLVFTRIVDGGIGVFWATSNMTAETPPYWGHDESDVLNIRLNGVMTRGGAPMGSPIYMTRGGGLTIGYNNSRAVNDQAVNEDISDSASIEVVFSDAFNTPFTVDRSGKPLVTSRTWK